MSSNVPPPRLEPGKRRLLTAGEVRIARQVFGGDIDPAIVKITYGKHVGIQADNDFMTPHDRGIYAHGNIYRDDYSAHPEWRWLFVHELAHIWQAQRGVNLLTASLPGRIRHLFDSDYNMYGYDLGDGGRHLESFNVEAQATIIADWDARRRGLSRRVGRTTNPRIVMNIPLPSMQALQRTVSSVGMQPQ